MRHGLDLAQQFSLQCHILFVVAPLQSYTPTFIDRGTTLIWSVTGPLRAQKRTKSDYDPLSNDFFLRLSTAPPLTI